MMNASKIFDIKKLESYVSDKLVSKRKHPILPIYIYNYTNDATFQNKWDEITLTCRGLILDEKYNVISRPFRKFFNLDTGSEPSTHRDNLPLTSPIVMEKVDGSLGILWKYKDQWGIATRGSFDSEQAIWATEFVKKDFRFKEQYCTKHIGFCSQCPVVNECLNDNFYNWRDDTTPLFEIIYPENRIVVDYKGDKKLVLLGVVNNDDGSEYTYEELKSTGYPYIVNSYKGKSLSDCINESELVIPFNAEGYVLKYEDSHPYPIRIKIKFADYVRIHRLMFTLNDRVIWESLKAEKDPRMTMDGLPKDAKEWLCNKTDLFLNKFIEIIDKAESVYRTRPEGTRKEIAEYFALHPDVKSVCFSMLDGKDHVSVAWKILEPKKAEIFRRVSNEEW